MTHEQYTESASSVRIHGILPSPALQLQPSLVRLALVFPRRSAKSFADPASLNLEIPLSAPNPHDAQDQTTSNMSSRGLSESPPILTSRLSGEWVVQGDASSFYSDSTAEQPRQHYAQAIHLAIPESVTRQSLFDHDESYTQHRASKRARTHFSGFAAAARQRLYQARRYQQLRDRKCVLQRSIALSARLLRATSWVRDGLVEITNQEDVPGFVKVYEHAQNLVDHCYSHWSNDLRNCDDVHTPIPDGSDEPAPKSFLRQLSQHSGQGLLQILSDLRSKPRVLLERFRALNVDQVAALWRHPRWQDVSDSVSHARVSAAQRRRHLQAFSRELEDYATSIERSDPLSFLLFNLYATDQSLHRREAQLRLVTWSTVCAELLIHDAESYNTLIGQVLIAFATTQDWPAKDRVELFLMDHLQKGAFLLDQDIAPIDDSNYDPLSTKHACDFFDNAINDLFAIFVDHGGGFPTGALALARAILGKLPPEKEQSFRSHVFYNWFLEYFLRITITHPENENMLLKIHISKRARDILLSRLISRAIDKIYDRDVSDEKDVLWNQCSHIINYLEAEPPITEPYSQTDQDEDIVGDTNHESPAVNICAYEVVQVLEALTPLPSHSMRSAGPFWQGMTASYVSTYSREATTPYDQIKADLRNLLEPGVTAKDVHPCSENWVQLEVRRDGVLHETKCPTKPPSGDAFAEIQDIDNVQKAAIRLCSSFAQTQSSSEVEHDPQHLEAVCLEELFLRQIGSAEAQLRTLDVIYWRKALVTLSRKYPLSGMARDDSAVLTGLTHKITALHSRSVPDISLLEDYVRHLETSYAASHTWLEKFTTSLDELRLKLWYVTSVIHGPGYGVSRDVAAALNNMNLSRARMASTFDNARAAFRPGSSRSNVSAVLSQSRNDTLELLKAKTDWGGPRKLDDSQIRYIREWLKKNDVENFCNGEERIHRFCMEIQNLAKMLTGESIKTSPELWTSELFIRERSAYEVHGLGPYSAPSTSRPASVRSDPILNTFPAQRDFRRGDHDNRSVVSEDRSSLRRGSIYNIFQESVASSRQFLPPGLAASSIGSGRGGSSATTASVASIFSQPYSSITSVSASAFSRPPSIIQEGNFNRVTSTLKQKRKFLQQMQQGLVCLLLSDLGCLVWSWGSETDAWLDKACQNAAVMGKLKKREVIADLIPIQSSGKNENPPGPKKWNKSRRSSSDNTDSGAQPLKEASTGVLAGSAADIVEESDGIDYLACLDDILLRLSQSIDPIEKLRAVNEFSDLANQQLQAETSQRTRPFRKTHQSVTAISRGRSADPPRTLTRDSTGYTKSPPSEEEVNRHLKRQFMKLKPRTLFRDLQYIAAFASPELADKSSRGKALWQVGVAAMSYKAEVCRSMVEVADDIVAMDSIKRLRTGNGSEESLSKAADYWKIGALEGDAAAQRELAMLYLMHPKMLPVVSSALYFSADIFKDGMMWQKPFGGNDNRQALCLALHWMQQARDNGDALAKQKLEERKQGISIR